MKVYIQKAHIAYGTKEDLLPLVECILEKKSSMTPFTLSSKHLESMAIFSFYSSKNAKPWIQQIKRYYHKAISSYAGPFFHEHLEKGRYRKSLFDLFMGADCDIKDPLNLLGALVLKKEEPFSQLKVREEITFRKMKARLLQTSSSSLFYFLDFTPYENDAYPKGFHTFSYLFKNGKETGSLVCQTKNAKIKTEGSDKDLMIQATYKEEAFEDQKERNEWVFYLLNQTDLKLSVDGQKATIFKLGESLQIDASDRRIEMKFEITKGSGDLLGSICFGNRPSQIHPEATDEHRAFDWKISLRTLRRSAKLTVCCKIQVTLKPLPETLLSDPKELGYQEKVPLHEDHCQHTV